MKLQFRWSSGLTIEINDWPRTSPIPAPGDDVWIDTDGRTGEPLQGRVDARMFQYQQRATRLVIILDLH